MKTKSKLFLLSLSCTVTTGALVGCSVQEDLQTIQQKDRPTVVEERLVEVKDTKQLVSHIGFLNGFPDEKMVEFKVIHENGEILRVFEMGKDISQYLSEEKQDGKTKFTLTYQESTDGIATPTLVKIEKMSDQ